MQRFPDHSDMAYFTDLDWDNQLFGPRILESTEVWLPCNDFWSAPPDDTTSSNTPAPSSASPDSTSETHLKTTPNPKSKKRRQTSEDSQSDALIRPPKTRIIKDRLKTAKVREKGACLSCKRAKKGVSPVCKVLVLSRHSN
jgi:hypothetical protein